MLKCTLSAILNGHETQSLTKNYRFVLPYITECQKDMVLTSSFPLLRHIHGSVLPSIQTQSRWDAHVAMPPTLLRLCSVWRDQGSYADFQQRWQGLAAEWWDETADHEGQGWRLKRHQSWTLPWLAQPAGTRQGSGRICLLLFGPQCPPGQTEKDGWCKTLEEYKKWRICKVKNKFMDRRWQKHAITGRMVVAFS